MVVDGSDGGRDGMINGETCVCGVDHHAGGEGWYIKHEQCVVEPTCI